MSFFKAYDMRGTFGTDFDLDTVYRVGLALPRVIAGRSWLVGRDCRVTSREIHDALVAGLSEAGAEVADLGLCTTPMVYFFTAQDGYDGSVMITASHNPPSDNGLKVSMRTALPVGYANGLSEVEKLVAGDTFAAAARREEAVRRMKRTELADAALSRYVAWQKSRASVPAASLRFAVDCSNGMASLLVRELFPGAVVINGEMDGAFPNHSPNPLKDEARSQLSALVRERGLDCGVIFDGDADRAMFVDERGEFIQPDYLIPVVARATLRHLREDAAAGKPSGAGPRQASKVIHDVRTSRSVIEELRRMGCEPVMVPVGHAFAKPALRRTGAVCGGELAGHYYFGEFHGCDSGALAAARILEEVALAKAEGRTFGEMMRELKVRYANSGERNFKVEDKDAAIARVLKAAAEHLPPERSRSEMDGLRIEYDEGWINIRKSNTEPYLRLIAECDTPERLGSWLSELVPAMTASPAVA